jgi:hypothetical protein
VMIRLSGLRGRGAIDEEGGASEGFTCLTLAHLRRRSIGYIAEGGQIENIKTRVKTAREAGTGVQKGSAGGIAEQNAVHKTQPPAYLGTTRREGKDTSMEWPRIEQTERRIDILGGGQGKKDGEKGASTEEKVGYERVTHRPLEGRGKRAEGPRLNKESHII